MHRLKQSYQEHTANRTLNTAFLSLTNSYPKCNSRAHPANKDLLHNEYKSNNPIRYDIKAYEKKSYLDLKTCNILPFFKLSLFICSYSRLRKSAAGSAIFLYL
uniref:Uncharacterized protein n=1 Tax=Romanomermis culicivorax TaxID=13658 RepID=A0A915K485_ROMCU